MTFICVLAVTRSVIFKKEVTFLTCKVTWILAYKAGKADSEHMKAQDSIRT